MPEVKQWEACALSLNVNPNKMRPHPQGWMAGPNNGPTFIATSFPSATVQTEFDNRARLLGASLFKSPHFANVNNLVIGGRHLATVNLSEFAAWGLSVELDMPPELVAMATGMQPAPAQNAAPAPVVAASDTKQWLQADPRDPAPAQHWYTPARYFARQLVVSDSTLLIKKLVLADKVSKSLANVGIYKRGDKKPLDAATVQKAFVKVQLG